MILKELATKTNRVEYKDLELVEHLGSGLHRILTAYGKESFIVKENYMRNVFYSNTDDIQEDEGISEGTSEGISEGIKFLYTFIKNNPSLRVSQISQKIDTPSKTLERWIKQLKDENKIEYIGSKKTGGYSVK